MSDELTLTTTQSGDARAVRRPLWPMIQPPHDPEKHVRLAARIEATGYHTFWDAATARAWTLRHFGEWYTRLTAAERRGLEDYIARGKEIGSHLRAGDGWGRGFIRDIDSMLDEVRTPEAVALTRLWAIRPNPMIEARLNTLGPGDVFIDRAFLSTSIGWTWGVAEKVFQDNLWRLPSVILVPAGARFLPLWGCYVPGPGLSRYLPRADPWRHEILLPRDLPLRLLEQPTAENCYRLIFKSEAP